MPIGKSGQYHMNPNEMRRKGDSPDEAAPVAKPQVSPQAADAGAAETITLTKNPDGTVMCDDGSGQPSMHNSMDEALQYLSSTEGSQDQDQGMPETPAEDTQDLAGMYSKPKGATKV